MTRLGFAKMGLRLSTTSLRRNGFHNFRLGCNADTPSALSMLLFSGEAFIFKGGISKLKTTLPTHGIQGLLR